MRCPGALLLLVLLALCGCGSRENAKAARQADQAVAGVATIASAEDLRRALEQLSPEARAVVDAALHAIVQLAGSARTSLAPVIARLEDGTPAAVTTTPPATPAEVPAFVQEAAKQAGRAEAETARALAWHQLLGIVWQSLPVAGKTGLQALLAALGVGGTGGVIFAITRIAAVVRQARQDAQQREIEAQRWRAATAVTAAYGDAMEQAETSADVARVKAVHRGVQDAAGLHPLIQAARGKGGA